MNERDLSAAVTLLYTHGIITSRERDLARRRIALEQSRNYAAKVNKLTLGRAAIIKLDAHRRKA
jgi:hypothetical protein